MYAALIDEHAKVNNEVRISSDRAEAWKLVKNANGTMKMGEEPLVSEMFRKLKPVAYSLKSDIESKRTSFGFIAQEMIDIYPSVVGGTHETQLSVSYTDMIAVITLTLQQEMSRLDLVQTLLENVETVAGQHDTVLADSEVKISMLEQELAKLKDSYIDRLSTWDTNLKKLKQESHQ